MNLNTLDKWLRRGLALLPLIAAMSAVCLAQDSRSIDQLPAAPPMRTIPEAERAQLNEVKDSKTRIKKAVGFADAHLLRAETAANQQQFDLSLRELGIYLGLFEYAFRFIAKLNSGDSGKSRDLYKHIELALRSHGPRLTVMRRATPLEYATRMKEVEDYAREGRTDALNAFYGHTVVRDAPSGKPEQKPKQTTPNPER